VAVPMIAAFAAGILRRISRFVIGAPVMIFGMPEMNTTPVGLLFEIFARLANVSIYHRFLLFFFARVGRSLYQ
jgi:hypothetical protein